MYFTHKIKQTNVCCFNHTAHIRICCQATC